MNTLQLIFASIDELNLDLGENEKIRKSETTSLFGSGDSLDSLALINLITIIEEKIEEETGEYVSLADEKAMSLEESPFKTVTTLKDYINILVNGEKK